MPTRPAIALGDIAATNRLALHVTCQELTDVANREDIGIENQRPSLNSHLLRNPHPKWAERLQVLVAPYGDPPLSQVGLALASLKVGSFLEPKKLHFERIRGLRACLQQMSTHLRPQNLLVVGMNDDARLHVRPRMSPCIDLLRIPLAARNSCAPVSRSQDPDHRSPPPGHAPIQTGRPTDRPWTPACASATHDGSSASRAGFLVETEAQRHAIRLPKARTTSRVSAG